MLRTRDAVFSKGEEEGHPFRGNQWTGGRGTTTKYRQLASGDKVDGRTVRGDIPNQASIESSLTEYDILPGIHEVPTSAFDPRYKPKPYSIEESDRLDRLVSAIRDSKEISPLIVVLDDQGPYILEGGHRFDALLTLGAKTFPAQVVVDTESAGTDPEKWKWKYTAKATKSTLTKADLPTEDEIHKAIATPLSDTLSDILADAFTDGGKQMSEVLGVGFDENDPETQAFLRERQTNLEDNLEGIDDTTAQIIKDAIAKSVEEHETMDETIRRVEESGAFTPGRAARIAKTELHTAIEAGSHAAGKQGGAEFKTWSSAMDDIVRESHRNANNQTVPIDKPFTLEMPDGGEEDLMFPGDPDASPANTVNCRCSTSFSLDAATADDVDAGLDINPDKDASDVANADAEEQVRDAVRSLPSKVTASLDPDEIDELNIGVSRGRGVRYEPDEARLVVGRGATKKAIQRAFQEHVIASVLTDADARDFWNQQRTGALPDLDGLKGTERQRAIAAMSAIVREDWKALEGAAGRGLDAEERSRFALLGSHFFVTPGKKGPVSQREEARKDDLAKARRTADDQAIPPGWSGVQRAERASAPVQAEGKDDKGRAVRVYSRAHAKAQAYDKFQRVRALDIAMAGITKRVRSDMRSDDPKVREPAAVLALIIDTGIRPGSDEDTGADKQAYGATTLEGRHVVVSGERVSLQFVGKKGVDQDVTVDDDALAAMIRERKSNAGEKGRVFDVSATALQVYTSDITGNKFTPKDFRTLKALTVAREQVARLKGSDGERKAKVREIAEAVAASLGNTPSVAVSSYIDPEVLDAVRKDADFEANTEKPKP